MDDDKQVIDDIELDEDEMLTSDSMDELSNGRGEDE